MAHWLLGLFHYFRAEIQRSHTIAAQLVDRADRLGSRLFASEATCSLAVTLVDMGEYNAALDCLQPLPSLCDDQRDGAINAFARQDPAVTGECTRRRPSGRSATRTRRAAHASSAPRTLASPAAPAETRVIASYFAAHIHQLRGDAFSAQHHAEHALAVADDYGLSVWVALSRIIRGWARVEQGAVADGISRPAARARRVSGHRRAPLARAISRISCSGVDASRTTRRRGGLSPALDLIRETERTAPPRICIASGRSPAGGRRRAGHARRPHAARLVADCRTARGQSRGVFQPRGHRRTGAAGQVMGLRAVTSLARLYRHQGKHTDVRPLVAPVLDWFSEGHDTTDLRTARAIVRSL